DQVSRTDWPKVEIVHLAFQLMIGTGTVLLAISAWFWWAYYRNREAVFERRWLLRAVALVMPLGFIGLEAGWFLTEAGRQPWIIQHVMRTSEAVTPAAGVLGMFIAFTLLYALLGVTVVVLLRRIARTRLVSGESA